MGIKQRKPNECRLQIRYLGEYFGQPIPSQYLKFCSCRTSDVTLKTNKGQDEQQLKTHGSLNMKTASPLKE